MTSPVHSAPGRRWSGRRVGLAVAAVAILVVVAANAHLVWVALKSQPDCVPHARSAGADGAHRAARSTC